MANGYGYVEVDFKKLDRAISAIENYLAMLENKMADAENEINILLQSCEGPDITMFKTKWESTTMNGSTYMDLRLALKSYLAFLKYAKLLYQSAQSKAIGRTSSL